MRVLEHQPRLIDLRRFIDKVSRYPISAAELTDMAKRVHYGESLVGLLGSFREDEYFLNKEDLLTRAEQVRFLNLEEQKEEQLL